MYYILQTIPISKPFFSKELIKDYTTLKCLKVIFLDLIPYQLWFIRDLIVLVFLSPLIFWLIKTFKCLILCLLLITWLLKFDFFILSNESLLFFIIGAFLRIEGLQIQNQFLVKELFLIAI